MSDLPCFRVMLLFLALCAQWRTFFVWCSFWGIVVCFRPSARMRAMMQTIYSKWLVA